MSAQLEIRPALPEDCHRLHAFLADAFDGHRETFQPSVLHKDTAALVGECEMWLLGLIDDEIIAAVNHEIDRKYYTFSYLSVRRDKRRMGYATHMYHDVARLAMQRGKRSIRVAVRRSITENIGFIENLGFSLSGPLEASSAHDVYVRQIGTDL